MSQTQDYKGFQIMVQATNRAWASHISSPGCLIPNVYVGEDSAAALAAARSRVDGVVARRTRHQS